MTNIDRAEIPADIWLVEVQRYDELYSFDALRVIAYRIT